MKRPRPAPLVSGFSLLELIVALSLTALLMLALVQVVSAGVSTTRLQDNQAALQDRLRFTAELLSNTVREAGFTPAPWNTESALAALGTDTTDGVTAHSDRLVIQGRSDRNCFESLNPDLDEGGRPRFYIRQTAFDLNGSKYLTRTCRYGPSPTGLVTQVRRQGLVAGVESFQLLFGEDSTLDGEIDRWVRAGQWSSENAVLGIRVGLLLTGDEGVAARSFGVMNILGQAYHVPADGKLRETLDIYLALRGRQR